MDELKPNHGIVLPSFDVEEEKEVISENTSKVETNATAVKCSNNSNDVSSDKCPDEVNSNNSNHSLNSIEVELSDASEPLDINGYDLKNVPKINVPNKNLSTSAVSTTRSGTSFNSTNNKRDGILEATPVTESDGNQLSNSFTDTPLRTSSKSFQFLCDSYSNIDDDDDNEDDNSIFISAKNKRLKLSTPVDL